MKEWLEKEHVQEVQARIAWDKKNTIPLKVKNAISALKTKRNTCHYMEITIIDISIVVSMMKFNKKIIDFFLYFLSSKTESIRLPGIDFLQLDYF